ncbi:hypothetical protein RQP46_008756 [Phenoliferia psychrophenolica]
MPLFASPDVDAFLDGILAQLAAGANPYLAIAEAVGGYLRTSPRQYSDQIIALSVIFALLNVMVVVSLCRKWKGDFWIFHILRTPRGRYIHPHLGISWQISTVVFLTGLQVYVWQLYFEYHGKASTFLSTFGALTYYPSWLGGWLAGVEGFITRPGVLNAHFIIVPFLVLASIATCCGIAAEHFQHVFQGYFRVTMQLESLAAGWNASATNTAEVVESTVAPLIKDAFKESDLLARSFQRIWRAWFIIAVYLYLIFSIIAFVHFNYIRLHILVPIRQVATSGHDRHLRRSLATLVLAVLCIAGIGFSFCGLAGWLAFGGEGVNSALNVIRLQTHLNLWTFAAFGTIASTIFLIQSTLTASETTGRSSQSASGSKNSRSRNAPLEINIDIVRATYVSRPEPAFQSSPRQFTLAFSDPAAATKSARDLFEEELEMHDNPRKQRSHS